MWVQNYENKNSPSTQKAGRESTGEGWKKIGNKNGKEYYFPFL
jgi:hypothetical protein